MPQASTAATAATPTKRKSEPASWTPYASGGPLGIYARRGADPLQFFSSEQLRDLVITNPLRVIRDLPRIHPSADMALNTAMQLMCPADGAKVIAEDPNPDGTLSADANEANVNAKDTAALIAMFDQLPAEVGGGLRGLRAILSAELMLTGMLVVEACPGQPLQGVVDIWPVDSLTCELTRKTRGARLTLQQRVRFPEAAPNAQGTRRDGLWGWQELPSETCFWAAVGQEAGDPHGRAPFAAALNEAIADMALMQDLRDAVHNAAWPRHDVGVNLTELHRVAVEVYGMRNAKAAAEWVNERFQEVVDYVANLGADDNIVHDSTGKVTMLQPGSFQGLEGVLSFLRQRIAQSLKTLPTLLGINDGSTFNYTSVEWAVYAQGLETYKAIVDEVITDICNLHLRLIGSKAKARIISSKIRTNDAQTDANAESTRITNATNKEKLGYVTHDQASMEITGKKAAGKPVAGVIEPLPQAPAVGGPGTKIGAGGNAKKSKVGNTTGPKPTSKNGQGGTTKEERNTAKKRTSE